MAGRDWRNPGLVNNPTRGKQERFITPKRRPENRDAARAMATFYVLISILPRMESR
jgi:hypothetical protein